MASKSDPQPLKCWRCGALACVSVRVGENAPQPSCAPCADNHATPFGLATITLLLADASANPDSCPSCGLTVDQLKSTQLTGCPLCYAVFKDELSTMLGIARST
ncbi:MAG: hypothetical protein WCO51_02940 [bacterium]